MHCIIFQIKENIFFDTTTVFRYNKGVIREAPHKNLSLANLG